jgi:hypothetical protein
VWTTTVAVVESAVVEESDRRTQKFVVAVIAGVA